MTFRARIAISAAIAIHARSTVVTVAAECAIFAADQLEAEHTIHAAFAIGTGIAVAAVLASTTLDTINGTRASDTISTHAAALAFDATNTTEAVPATFVRLVHLSEIRAKCSELLTNTVDLLVFTISELFERLEY